MKYPSLRERCIELLPGQYFDKETNLHYNYFRDYDPAIGRYIQSDPIGLVGGLNTYAYVENDPLSLFDRFGLLGTVLYANMKGVTLNEAVAVGQMGNAAAAVGLLPLGVVATGSWLRRPYPQLALLSVKSPELSRRQP